MIFLFNNNKNTPSWAVFIFDIAICAFSFVLAYLLRFNFSIPTIEVSLAYKAFIIVLLMRIISFFVSKTYSGIVSYTSTKDALIIVITNFSVLIALCIVNIVSSWVQLIYIIPFSIIIIDFIAATFLMVAYRALIKIAYIEIHNPSSNKRNVIIFGAGESGFITKRALDRDAGSKYKVIAFIDDDPKKLGKKIEGVKIYNSYQLNNLLTDNVVVHLILAIQSLSASRKAEIVDICLQTNTKVLNVPPVNNWINGELSFKQIKKINIEDLLERDVIKLDENRIKEQINNKVVLVTGAAGSIGSEIVRQISMFHPKLIVLLDQAETPSYHIELEMKEKYKDTKIEVVIGDIRSVERMEHLFNTFNPNVVFHAAAYKHVPMMENNPSESIYTNVLGTKIIADLSVKYNIEKFVMVSTDKAVNPTNVMGASKRIAEIYIQSLNTTTTTKFITTRFGNVLGSNGSVIPLFKSQIEKGGPITITHPEITRYFMTIPEACQLVLEAGAMGQGGEIFIFDMGKSVKIVDLAKKMIKLSGLTLDKDIKITFTGLRPGEKLYEELLANEENTMPTHHLGIMIAKVRVYDFAHISQEINELLNLFGMQNNNKIVSKMKKIVPEFVSQNSIYQKLDE